MRYSKLFGKTQKYTSHKFESKNHELLIKAGFVDQVGAGIFSLLPMGKTVIAKIENIVREEIDAIGAQEVLMPSLHPKALWMQTSRWESEDLFRVKSKHGQEYVLAGTHEEIVTPLVKKFVKSYHDLPLALYHITPKFRDEPRPKSGILRGREFRMKDLYSFHTDKDSLSEYYQKVTEAYLKIFERCGLKDVKITEASGGTFTQKLSHEFNVLTPSGEVDLIYCKECGFAQNVEVAKAKIGDLCPNCTKRELKTARAIEIGNIFDLDTKFARAFDLKYTGRDGQEQYLIMGCYGIGTTRLMGAVVEIHHDEKGIIWPENIAPFRAHLVGLDLKDERVKKKADHLYDILSKAGVEVLYDDRTNASAGEKLNDADLIGIPVRLIVSRRTGDKVEYRKRSETQSVLRKEEEILKNIFSVASSMY
jgi:prolyl-tRNA synthetase